VLLTNPAFFAGAGVFGSSIFFSDGFLIVADMLMLSTIVGRRLYPIFMLCITTFDFADDEIVAAGNPKICFLFAFVVCGISFFAVL